MTHVGAALAYLKLHDLRFDVDNPPLSKLISALPFVFAHVNVPVDTPERSRIKTPETMVSIIDRYFGDRILYGAGNSANHVLWLARLPMIFLTLLFCAVIFAFARDLFGNAGGLIALAIATLTPSLIAHGRLVNADVTGGGFLLLTAWLLWKGRSKPIWILGAGVAFGLSLASKSTGFTLIPAYGLLIGMSIFHYFRNTPTRRKLIRTGAWLAVFVGIAIAVVWGVYGLIDPKFRFDRPYPRADFARGVMATATKHLPLPAQYRTGMLSKISDEQSNRGAYLLGHAYNGAKLIFYPATLVIKTPLAALLIWLLGVMALLRSRKRRVFAVYLFAPAGLLFLAATFSNINIGMRSIILVPMAAAVAAGAVVHLQFRYHTMIVGTLIGLTALSAWWQFPSYLTYVNEAFGGPNNGYRLVSESDLDWAGQDLGRLRSYLDEHAAGQRVWLVFYGVVRPEAYGFNASNSIILVNAFQILSPAEYQSGATQLPPNYIRIQQGEVHGLVAVSAFIYQHPDQYPDFAKLGLRGPPMAQVGHSILLWRV
ncbi:MAG: ArnT family glycosyltransferase [Actinomycetota bacterium]